jgi:hypothetical protein
VSIVKRPECPDDPRLMLEQRMCLTALSKDLDGEIGQADGDRHICQTPPCATLTTTQPLRLRVSAHPPCDDRLARLFDGTLEIAELVHVFDVDGTRRGFHSGAFRWRGRRTLVLGQLSGMTNVGTHRRPMLDECQACDARGFMEGRFCGAIFRTTRKDFVGCHVFGSYRLRFPDPSSAGIPRQRLAGTLEGLLICGCAS